MSDICNTAEELDLMQDYKEWVTRWLGLTNEFGGELARRIYEDPDFPPGGDKNEILRRLKELRVSQQAMIAFRGTWKYYEKDKHKKQREVTLENRLVREVESRGGICWKFTSPGTVGVPDRVVMAPWGKVAFVEMKAPGRKLRPIQEKRANELRDIGISVYCLSSNQDIVDFLREMFDE